MSPWRSNLGGQNRAYLRKWAQIVDPPYQECISCATSSFPQKHLTCAHVKGHWPLLCMVCKWTASVKEPNVHNNVSFATLFLSRAPTHPSGLWSDMRSLVKTLFVAATGFLEGFEQHLWRVHRKHLTVMSSHRLTLSPMRLHDAMNCTSWRTRSMSLSSRLEPGHQRTRL